MHEGKTIEELGSMVSKATAKHTPGPFKVEFGKSPDDFIVTEPTGRTLCEPNAPLFGNEDIKKYDSSLRVIPLQEAIANAHLFAASSDMLAAFKEIGCIARTLAVALDGESKATDDSLAEIRKICQDAEAKAEGRA